MMQDKEKPFVCYQGKGSLHIVPRGRAGWIAFCGGLITLLPIMGVFIVMQILLPGQTSEIVLGVGFVAATAVWSIFFIRWMKARSEIIDMDELAEIKRERDRNRHRNRR